MPLYKVNPQNDERWQSITATMRKHGYSPDALIETLHTVQDTFGYLDEEVLRRVAADLRIPLSKVYGVATFYHLFTLKPPAQHHCLICTGTACHIKGAARIMAAVEQALGIQEGGKTADGNISLEVVRCAAACDPAPLAIFDGETVGHLTPATAVEYIERWTNHASK